MSADVVAPITVEHVGGGRVVVRLEVERFPADDGITRESYLIAVVAQSAPTVIQHRPCVVMTLHICECGIVDPPHVAKSWKLLVVVPLLPVEPPEVDAVAFHRSQHFVIPSLHESFGRGVPCYILLLGRIHAHPTCHVGVAILIILYAIGRMKVDCCLQLLLLCPLHEASRRGKESLVPCISGPSATSFLSVVPVHVHHKYVHRDAVRVHLADELTQFVVAIAPVARPPVAERIAGWQRFFACKDRKVVQSLLVVVAISEEIHVLCLAFVGAMCHPLPVAVVEYVALRVVYECPSASRQQSVFYRHLASIATRVAVITVECAVGSLQIGARCILLSGMPCKGNDTFAVGRLLLYLCRDY